MRPLWRCLGVMLLSASVGVGADYTVDGTAMQQVSGAWVPITGGVKVDASSTTRGVLRTSFYSSGGGTVKLYVAYDASVAPGFQAEYALSGAAAGTGTYLQDAAMPVGSRVVGGKNARLVATLPDVQGQITLDLRSVDYTGDGGYWPPLSCYFVLLEPQGSAVVTANMPPMVPPAPTVEPGAFGYNGPLPYVVTVVVPPSETATVVQYKLGAAPLGEEEWLTYAGPIAVGNYGPLSLYARYKTAGGVSDAAFQERIIHPALPTVSMNPPAGEIGNGDPVQFENFDPAYFTVRYSTFGDPDNFAFDSGSTVNVTPPATLYARAYDAATGERGPLVCAAYTWASNVVAEPVLDPPTKVFSTTFQVQATTATPGAVIRYTLDGSTPTQSSALWLGPLTVSSSAVLKVRAFKSGMSASPVKTSFYQYSASGVGGAPPDPDSGYSVARCPDTDGDGLPDVVEQAFASQGFLFNPEEPADPEVDSDGDGIPDIWELKHVLTCGPCSGVSGGGKVWDPTVPGTPLGTGSDSYASSCTVADCTAEAFLQSLNGALPTVEQILAKVNDKTQLDKDGDGQQDPCSNSPSSSNKCCCCCQQWQDDQLEQGGPEKPTFIAPPIPGHTVPQVPTWMLPSAPSQWPVGLSSPLPAMGQETPLVLTWDLSTLPSLGFTHTWRSDNLSASFGGYEKIKDIYEAFRVPFRAICTWLIGAYAAVSAFHRVKETLL